MNLEQFLEQLPPPTIKHLERDVDPFDIDWDGKNITDVVNVANYRNQRNTLNGEKPNPYGQLITVAEEAERFVDVRALLLLAKLELAEELREEIASLTRELRTIEKDLNSTIELHGILNAVFPQPKN